MSLLQKPKGFKVVYQYFKLLLLDRILLRYLHAQLIYRKIINNIW